MSATCVLIGSACDLCSIGLVSAIKPQVLSNISCTLRQQVDECTKKLDGMFYLSIS